MAPMASGCDAAAPMSRRITLWSRYASTHVPARDVEGVQARHAEVEREEHLRPRVVVVSIERADSPGVDALAEVLRVLAGLDGEEAQTEDDRDANEPGGGLVPPPTQLMYGEGDGVAAHEEDGGVGRAPRDRVVRTPTPNPCGCSVR